MRSPVVPLKIRDRGGKSSRASCKWAVDRLERMGTTSMHRTTADSVQTQRGWAVKDDTVFIMRVITDFRL
jgi:hypothetical protein